MEELKSFCSHLIHQMEKELLNIRLEYPQTSDWSQHSIPYLESCLDQLKQYIKLNPFKKRSEEIYFFKEVKPVVMGRMIFLCEAYNKDALHLSHDLAVTKDYLAEEMEAIEDFFKKHDSLYDYYKEKSDGLDFQLFVRKIENRFTFRDLPIEVNPVLFYGDPEFSTSFDYLFAQFRGYELLKDHLENELEALFLVGDEVPAPTFDFTGSPADFVMMIEMFKKLGSPKDPETGKPISDEELFQKLRGGLKIDLPEDIDFATLKLISGNSDLPERMADALDKLHDKWDKENDDVDYENTEGDDPDKEKPKDQI